MIRALLVGVLLFASVGTATAQVAFVEHRAVFTARISLPETWVLDSLPAIRALEDSMKLWVDDFTEARYRFAATTLQASPVLRGRGPGNESAALSLNYVPSVTLDLLDTLSAPKFAELAVWRCETLQRQLEAAGASMTCGEPKERKIGDWRALVSFQRIRLGGSTDEISRADVVIPMHGAMFFAAITVPARDGDVDFLERIVATIQPPFTRAGAEP